jgi:putative transposase
LREAPLPNQNPLLHDISEDDWAVACAREPVIRGLIALDAISRSECQKAEAALGLERTWVFELVRRYRENPVTSSLVFRKAGFPKGEHRLDRQVEDLIEEVLNACYLKRPAPKVSKVHKDIRRTCIHLGLPPPAYGTVKARAELINTRYAKQKREGKKAANDAYRPVTCEYEADYALHIVQMDHTLADIYIVDDIFRLPIGRPWLSLLIDVASRYIVGYYASLEHPSSTSVAMAIRQAVLSKEKWLFDRGLDVEWLSQGLLDYLHLDNAPEFHSEALERGCSQHTIDLIYRPRKTPHYGGHIERLIGTQMGELHLLPGTTFSNIKDKGDYDSEGKACFTLDDFEAWSNIQIAIYNNEIHSALKLPPRIAWKDELEKRPLPVRYPVDEQQFLFDFLPFKKRMVRRTGIQLNNLFYWDPVLEKLALTVRGKLRVKYNPRNLSIVYLEAPNGHHWPIRYRDIRRPPITLFEHNRATRELRERGRALVDEELIFQMVQKQRRILANAASKTKAARRTVQRVVGAIVEGASVQPPVLPKALPPPDPQIADDSDVEIIPFYIEERG